MKSLRYLTSRRADKAASFLESHEASMAGRIKANIGIHGIEITALDVANKITGGGHVLKESSHTEDIMKGNTRIYIKRPCLNTTNTFRENMGLDSGILKNGCKLLFLCTPLNVEFSNNHLTFENSEFADDLLRKKIRYYKRILKKT